MNKEKKKANIVVLGNGVSAMLVAILLSNNYTIVSISDSTLKRGVLPFYPNDMIFGIMKQFFCDLDIDDLETSKCISKVKLFVNQHWIEMGNSLNDLENFLEANYLDEADNLKKLFSAIREVGKEWESFIKNRFDSRNVKFVQSPKYMNSLQKTFDKFNIQNNELRSILSSFIPVSDVSFTVYAGYIYTQFFDMNATSYNVWEFIHKLADEKISKSVVVKDIKELDILKETDACLDADIVECADSIIDFRGITKVTLHENENQTILRGAIADKKTVFEKDIFYLIKIDDKHSIRIWHENAFDYSNIKGTWQYEFVSSKADCEILLNQLQEWLQEFIDPTIYLEKEKVCNSNYFEKEFDVIGGSGYCWAFNQKQSMKDPTNLFTKHKSAYINCSYWGFAWFSAAYHAFNVVQNQMEFTENKLKIVRKKGKQNE